MLVLSRRQNEMIVIGDGKIEIVVIEIRGDKVRLGIKAPPEIPVHRSEIYDKIQQASRAQSGPAAEGTPAGAPAR